MEMLAEGSLRRPSTPYALALDYGKNPRRMYLLSTLPAEQHLMSLRGTFHAAIPSLVKADISISLYRARAKPHGEGLVIAGFSK